MAKRYKCPYCDVRLERPKLIEHIEKKHEELIPEGYTATRIVYDVANKTSGGRCRVCGKPTQWNESSGRYDVLCGDPKCKQHMRDEYKKNMLRVKGTYNILNDPEQQTKMLANRSISGTYKFSDGGEVTYTGSYERKCLEFMDVVMQIPSKDIIAPGPTLYYTYEGKEHFYITDFYYPNYNLIIEVKDGGDNPNMKDTPGMRSSRERTIEKEHLITDQGQYNYVRLTNNDFSQLIEVFMNIKQKLIEGIDSPTIMVNESEQILSYAQCMNEYAPGNFNAILSIINETAKIAAQTTYVFNEAEAKSYGLRSDVTFFDEAAFCDVVDSGTIKDAFESVVHTIKWCRMDSAAFCSILEYHEPVDINGNSFTAGKFTSTNRIDEVVRVINSNNIFSKGKYSASVNENNELVITITELNGSVIEAASKIDPNHKTKTGKKFRFFDLKDDDADIYLKQNSYCRKYWNYIHHDTIGMIAVDVETDKLAGYVFVDNKKYPGFIVPIEVIKEYRGYGVGRRLLYNAIHKYGAIDLCVDKDNEVAIELYKKNGFAIIGDGESKNQYWMKLKSKLTAEEKSKAESIQESKVFNKEDIYYNKDKFDSGEINLCFITGHSGSGKSTMAHGMEGSKIEAYELDDVIFNWNFSDSNLKEYGDLIYSFFKGPGKRFRYTSKKEWDEDKQWDNKDEYKDGYEVSLITAFVNYTMQYAKAHKDTKFVLEGVWIFQFINPSDLDPYAVYIKGTSMLISQIRAAKRDSKEALSGFGRAKAITKQIVGNFKLYMMDEKKINAYRSHFESKIK